MSDIDLPDEFPIMRGHARRAERFDEAVAAFRAGLGSNGIRNVTYNGAKSVLGAALEEAWRGAVSEPFTYAGKFANLPKEVCDLVVSISPTSLHAAISAHKKVSKSHLDHPAVTAMKSILEEALPLAEAARHLKSHLVKGRAPSQKPATPPNPDQVRGTCSCCQRDVAVTQAGEGGMAHHGYQRPGYGSQTGSCPGVNFQPLEKSLEGLHWYIDTIQKHRERCRTALDAADGRDTVPYRIHRHPYSGTANREDPDFPAKLADYKRQQQSMIREDTSLLEFLATSLEEWQARHDRGDRDEPANDTSMEP